MNKIVAIIVCIFCIQTMNAQTTLSINFLKSAKWMIIKEGVEEGIKIDHAYYLSDVIPGNYDATKVGKATNGKYITFHNVTSKYENPNGYSTFEITRSSNSEIVLTLCSFTPGEIDQVGRELILKKKQ